MLVFGNVVETTGGHLTFFSWQFFLGMLLACKQFKACLRQEAIKSDSINLKRPPLHLA